jgi:hypothetical protein
MVARTPVYCHRTGRYTRSSSLSVYTTGTVNSQWTTKNEICHVSVISGRVYNLHATDNRFLRISDIYACRDTHRQLTCKESSNCCRSN